MAFLDVAATDSLFSWEDESGSTQTLNVDVVMAATDKRTAKLTDHVVETGAVITDHVVIQPEVISLELLVTQTPLTGTNTSVPIDAPSTKLVSKDYPLDVQPNAFVPGGFYLLTQGVQQLATSAVNALLGAAGAGQQVKGSDLQQTSSKLTANVLQGDAADRVLDVHDKLIEIMNGALLVTVSFKGRLYSDYLLEEVEMKNVAGKYGCASFSVKARALHTVDGTVAQLPDPADFRAKANVAKGNKPTKTPDPDPKKVSESDLHKGGAALASLLGG